MEKNYFAFKKLILFLGLFVFLGLGKATFAVESCTQGDQNKCNPEGSEGVYTTCPVRTWCKATGTMSDPKFECVALTSAQGCSENGVVTLEESQSTAPTCPSGNANSCKSSSGSNESPCPYGTWCDCRNEIPGSLTCPCKGFDTNSSCENGAVSLEEFMDPDLEDVDARDLPNKPYKGPLYQDIVPFLTQVAKILYYAGILIALLFTVYSGYLLMTSEGNPQKVQEGKEQLTASIIGLLFIVLSGAILRIIINTIIGA